MSTQLLTGQYIAATDIQQLDLVQQYMWLEAPLATSFTHQLCQSLNQTLHLQKLNPQSGCEITYLGKTENFS